MRVHWGISNSSIYPKGYIDSELKKRGALIYFVSHMNLIIETSFEYKEDDDYRVFSTKTYTGIILSERNIFLSKEDANLAINTFYRREIAKKKLELAHLKSKIKGIIDATITFNISDKKIELWSYTNSKDLLPPEVEQYFKEKLLNDMYDKINDAEALILNWSAIIKIDSDHSKVKNGGDDDSH